MRTSIATVCLSGTLTEKLHAMRRGRLRRRRDLRARPGGVARPARRRSPRWPAGSGSRWTSTSRSATPRASPRTQFARGAAPGAVEVPADAAAGHRHHAGVQQRRHRDRRRRRGVGRPAAPARRGGRGARRAAGLRGTRLGTVRRRLPARLADRGAGRPPGGRRLPRQLPHPLPRPRPGGDRADPGREDLLPAARGRAGADDGRAVVEPPPPALPRRGLLRPRHVRRPRPRRRLHRADLARGLQRHVPADRGAAHRPAGQALADLAGGPGGAAARAGATARRPRPAAGRRPARRASTSSRSRPRTPARSTSCCASSASPSVATTAASRCACGPRVAPASCATSSRRGSGCRRWPPSASRSPTRRRRRIAPAGSTRRRSSGVPTPTSRSCAAFRAPDGTEVFLADLADGDADWVPEFEGGQDAADDLLLTGIDHVNLAQPWQNFDEAVLFYSSVLACESGSSQDVAAPTGLVRSHVVRTDDGAVGWR